METNYSEHLIAAQQLLKRCSELAAEGDYHGAGGCAIEVRRAAKSLRDKLFALDRAARGLTTP